MYIQNRIVYFECALGNELITFKLFIIRYI